VSYDEKEAERLLKTQPNLHRWHKRAHAVRTHEHCGLGFEYIELVIARELERAYQDGRRDGSIAERETALRGMLLQAEGIENDARSRAHVVRQELERFQRAPKTMPVGDERDRLVGVEKPFGCSSDCHAPGCGGGCSQ
jgi:hypothetical protein